MLTDPACKNASCPEGKPRVRFADSGGLYLEVAPNGSKRWFWKYRFEGKEKRLALGSYPDVPLKSARQARDDAKKTQQAGTDPVMAKRIEKLSSRVSAESTFEAVALEFHEGRAADGGWSETHAAQWLRTVKKDLFPWLGRLGVGNITPPILLEQLRRVEARGAIRSAHDLREYAGQVFRYAIATGRCERNPAHDLRGALRPYVERHMPAVLDPAAAGELLRGIDAYAGQPATRAALALSALLFQRPGNIRTMEWAEIDAAAGLWTIPSAKMKRTVHGKVNGRPHFVPLAPQAVAILEEIRPLTGHGKFVFPSMLTGERPMSDNTVRTALRRMGYGNDDMTAHGFRAMARTLMVERLPGINPDVIEAQLAHGKSGPLGAAYDRAEFMEQRRRMMIEWADYLDRLRDGAQVIPIRAA